MILIAFLFLFFFYVGFSNFKHKHQNILVHFYVSMSLPWLKKNVYNLSAIFIQFTFFSENSQLPYSALVVKRKSLTWMEHMWRGMIEIWWKIMTKALGKFYRCIHVCCKAYSLITYRIWLLEFLTRLGHRHW